MCVCGWVMSLAAQHVDVHVHSPSVRLFIHSCWSVELETCSHLSIVCLSVCLVPSEGSPCTVHRKEEGFESLGGRRTEGESAACHAQTDPIYSIMYVCVYP